MRIIVNSVSVCLFVCPLANLKNQRPNFTKFSVYMLPVVVNRSSSDDKAICYVLPVLWVTSLFWCFHIMALIGPNQSWRVYILCFAHFPRWRHRGRSLTSPTTFCSRYRGFRAQRFYLSKIHIFRKPVLILLTGSDTVVGLYLFLHH